MRTESRTLPWILGVVPILALLLATQAQAGFEFGAIHGTKWNDLNGNGVQDAGEPGLADWTIMLDQGNDGTFENFVATDADGNYWFTDLIPGEYLVAEELQPGWVQTFPSGDGSHILIVRTGEIIEGVDFGNSVSPAVPEPSGIVLFGVGAFFIGGVIRRKRC